MDLFFFFYIPISSYLVLVFGYIRIVNCIRIVLNLCISRVVTGIVTIRSKGELTMAISNVKSTSEGILAKSIVMSISESCK